MFSHGDRVHTIMTQSVNTFSGHGSRGGCLQMAGVCRQPKIVFVYKGILKYSPMFML